MEHAGVKILKVLKDDRQHSTLLGERLQSPSAPSEPASPLVIKVWRRLHGCGCGRELEIAKWGDACKLLPQEARLVRLVELEGGCGVAAEPEQAEVCEKGEHKNHRHHHRRHHRQCRVATAPYCEGGSLEALLAEQGGYTLEEALRWGLQMARTIYLLHTTPNVRRCHGDVSLRRVLLREEGGRVNVYLRGPGLSGPSQRKAEEDHVEPQPPQVAVQVEEEQEEAKQREGEGEEPSEAEDVVGWGVVLASLLGRRGVGGEELRGLSAVEWEARVMGQWGHKEGGQEERDGHLKALAELARRCVGAREVRPSMRWVLCTLAGAMEGLGVREGLGREELTGAMGLLARLPGLVRREPVLGKGRGGKRGGGAARGLLLWPDEEGQLVDLEDRLMDTWQCIGRGGDDEVYATLLWNKAMLHKRLGEGDVAMHSLERALRGLDRASPIGLYCLSELAALCRSAGEHERALHLYDEALKLGRKALPSGHPDLARFLHNLSMVHYGLGEHDQALTLLEEALLLKRRTLPPGDPEVATALANIAVVQEARGNQLRALQMCEVALRLRRAALPPDHPHILSSLDTLAHLYQASGQVSKALPLCEEALHLRRLTQANPADVARSLSNMAALLEAKSEDALALPLLEEALHLRRQCLDPHHPDIATSLVNLGGRYRARGDLDRALSLYREALDTRRRVLPCGHPDLVSSLCVMATLHRARGEHELSEVYDSEAKAPSPGSSSPGGDTASSSSSDSGEPASAAGDATSAAVEKLSRLGTKMERSTRRDDEQELSFSPHITMSMFNSNGSQGSGGWAFQP